MAFLSLAARRRQNLPFAFIQEALLHLALSFHPSSVVSVCVYMPALVNLRIPVCVSVSVFSYSFLCLLCRPSSIICIFVLAYLYLPAFLLVCVYLLARLSDFVSACCHVIETTGATMCYVFVVNSRLRRNRD